MYTFDFASYAEYSRFIRWFVTHIGIEYEADHYDDGTCSVTVFEATATEIRKILDHLHDA